MKSDYNYTGNFLNFPQKEDGVNRPGLAGKSISWEYFRVTAGGIHCVFSVGVRHVGDVRKRQYPCALQAVQGLPKDCLQMDQAI